MMRFTAPIIIKGADRHPPLCEAQQCRFGQGSEAAAGADVKGVIAVLELSQSQGIQSAFHDGHSGRPHWIPKNIDSLAPAICEARLVLLPSLIFPPLLETLDFAAVEVTMCKINPTERADPQFAWKPRERFARDSSLLCVRALCRDVFLFRPTVSRKGMIAFFLIVPMRWR